MERQSHSNLLLTITIGPGTEDMSGPEDTHSGRPGQAHVPDRPFLFPTLFQDLTLQDTRAAFPHYSPSACARGGLDGNRSQGSPTL